MSRGLLDDETLLSISGQLPSIEDLQKTVLEFSPDLLSTNFKPDSLIPLAGVCLQDAVNTLSEARYALHEALAHRIWYLEKREPKNRFAAVFFGRFYTDDIALRLYSGGEHLAKAIVNMLEIREQDLTPYRRRRVSRLAILRNYLRKERPTSAVTVAVLGLTDSRLWLDTVKYRNAWVHSQPPLIKGLGIVYKRGQRWKLSDTGNSHVLGFGGGDEPEYSLDDLLEFMRPALFRFAETVNTIVQFYIELLKNHGFSLSEGP